MLVGLLYREALLTAVDIHLVSDRRLKRVQRKKYRDIWAFVCGLGWIPAECLTTSQVMFVYEWTNSILIETNQWIEWEQISVGSTLWAGHGRMNSNLLDSNLDKIFHNMFVLQHNCFRNSLSIPNSNFVHKKKHYQSIMYKQNTKEHCAHTWHMYMNIKIRSINLHEIYIILVSVSFRKNL